MNWRFGSVASSGLKASKASVLPYISIFAAPIPLTWAPSDRRGRGCRKEPRPPRCPAWSRRKIRVRHGRYLMSDWLHNLPLAWMALAVFGFTYLTAALIHIFVMVLAKGERAHAFKAVSPGVL